MAPAESADTRPWLRFYGKVQASLTYPDLTLYQAVCATAARVPDAIAWDFFDTTSTYRQFVRDIDTCADALAAIGLEAGDRLLISMPTSPQGVIAFYAANKLGALPAMIHPLSTAPEIERYLNISGARIALTLDAFGDFSRAMLGAAWLAFFALIEAKKDVAFVIGFIRGLV